jgi:hypothetical protein
MHSSDSGYARYQQEWEGNGSEMLPFVSNAPRPPRLRRSQSVFVMPWAMKSQTSSAVTGRAVAPSRSPG